MGKKVLGEKGITWNTIDQKTKWWYRIQYLFWVCTVWTLAYTWHVYYPFSKIKMVKQCLWVKIRCYFPESISSNSFKILEISTCWAHLPISRRLHRPAPRRWRHEPRALASSCPAQPGKFTKLTFIIVCWIEYKMLNWIPVIILSSSALETKFSFKNQTSKLTFIIQIYISTIIIVELNWGLNWKCWIYLWSNNIQLEPTRSNSLVIKFNVGNFWHLCQ